MKLGLSYDDVLLVPKQGILNKRKDADISSKLISGYKLEVPIISANMPSVTEHHMASAMYRAGGFGILHRFCDFKYQIEEYKYVSDIPGEDCGIAIGLHDGIQRAFELAQFGCKIFCLDVAHGDHVQVIKFIKEFKKNIHDGQKLIVGNIATAQGALNLIEAGADAIKVGIGPGAACKTREVTGFGVPQLTAIMNVAKPRQLGYEYRIIADGGIKNSGDIVKALAAGADTVMIGSLLAGCDEAPIPGEYYGNASERMNGHRAPEGVSGYVERKGPVENVIKELAWGIRSGISYGGATNIKELRENAEFIQVTAAGQIESTTRLSLA